MPNFDLDALVRECDALRARVEADLDFEGKREWLSFPPTLPAPVARLMEHLEGQAEASASALRVAAFFAQGCRSNHGWQRLSTGPHGGELLHQAWLLYETMRWPADTWLRNTCGVLSAYRLDQTGSQGLRGLLNSTSREEVGLGLLACGGVLWTDYSERADLAELLPLEDVEPWLFVEDPALCEAAIWAWASIHRERRRRCRPSAAVMNRLASLWLDQSFATAAYALCQQMGACRDAWAPLLTDVQAECCRSAAHAGNSHDPEVKSNNRGAALVVAFHAGNVWSDEELSVLFKQVMADRRFYIRTPAEDRDRIITMFEQLNISENT